METSTERGGFFAREETHKFIPKNEIVGQANPFSCVAAVCRMILKKYGDDEPEAYLRNAFDIKEEGASIKVIAEFLKTRRILQRAMIAHRFRFRDDLSFEELEEYVQKDLTVVSIRTLKNAHAVVIERIFDDEVFILDPLPEMQGSAYYVRKEIFLPYWFLPNSETGLAVVLE